MYTKSSILSLVLLLLAFNSMEASWPYQNDSAAVVVYECPICTADDEDSMLVADCLADCPGFSSTDYNDGHPKCIDRKLFRRAFLWRDLLTMLVSFLAAGVSAAAGVGGGGIYVPAGILLLSFAPKQSSGLAQACTFGTSVGSLLLNLRYHHPKSGLIHDAPGVKGAKGGKKAHCALHREELLKVDPTGTTYTRPLIDYDMTLFLSPLQMAGAVLGVLIQKMFPDWLYLLLAVIVLVLTSCKTSNMYRTKREKEREIEEERSRLKPGDGTTSGATTENSLVPEGEDLVTFDRRATTGECFRESPVDTMLEQRQAFLTQDARQFPKEKLIALIVLWIGLLFLTLLKGENGDSLVGITCESPWYLVILEAQFFWMVSFAMVFGLKLLRDQRARRRVQYPFLADDVVWNIKLLRFYGIFTFLAGIVAGLIGIGGGMVLGPLMLVMGIHPRVSTATTNTMVALTSSSVAVIFITNGYVPWTYAASFFAICLVGSILGQSTIDGYIKKTRQPSLLVLILAVVIALAAAGCVVIFILKLNENSGHFEGFHEFCKATTKKSVVGCTTVPAL